MVTSHPATQLASRNSRYYSMSIILGHHMDAVLCSLDDNPLQACQLSIGVLYDSYDAAMQIKLMRSLLGYSGGAQHACDILPPQEMQRPQHVVPALELCVSGALIDRFWQGMAKTRHEELQAGPCFTCKSLCAVGSSGCRRVASWEYGAYMHCPGTGCCRPSSLSLVPESSCLAASPRGCAFFSFPAGLSSSRLRSCHSKPVKRLCRLSKRQCTDSHLCYTLSGALQLVATSMPHTTAHHAIVSNMFRSCPTCCLRPRAALDDATFGFPSAILSNRDRTNGPFLSAPTCQAACCESVSCTAPAPDFA